MSKEVNLNKSLYKTELVFLKLLLPIMGLSYAVTSCASFIPFAINPYIQIIAHFFGMFLAPMIFMLISSYVFKFCEYHRLFIYYIIVDELLRQIDWYFRLPISNESMYKIHVWLTAVFVIAFIILFIYKKYKSNLKVCKDDTKNNKKSSC